jgi:hypothetical protein
VECVLVVVMFAVVCVPHNARPTPSKLMDYDDWEVHFDENLEEFQRRYKRPATYTVLFW